MKIIFGRDAYVRLVVKTEMKLMTGVKAAINVQSAAKLAITIGMVVSAVYVGRLVMKVIRGVTSDVPIVE